MTLTKSNVRASEVTSLLGRRIQTPTGIAFCTGYDLRDGIATLELVDADEATELPQHIQRHVHGESMQWSELMAAGWMLQPTRH